MRGEGIYNYNVLDDEIFKTRFSSDDGDFHWAANTCKRKRSALKRDQSSHSEIMRLRAHTTPFGKTKLSHSNSNMLLVAFDLVSASLKLVGKIFCSEGNVN